MAEESLLVVAQVSSCTGHHDPPHRHPCSQQEDDRNCTATRRQALWSIAESSSTSCFLCYIRPRFALAGFLFGALMELAYVQTLTLGYATLERTAPTSTRADPSSYSIRIDTWTDVFFYELSFLYADVLFLLYLIILTRSAIKANLSLSLPILAANCTVGVVWGLSVAVASSVGPKALIQERIWQVLGSMVIGIALCFLTYTMAVELQLYHWDNTDISSSSCPSSSFLASSCEGADQAEQKRGPGEHLYVTTSSMMVEAHDKEWGIVSWVLVL